MRSKVVTVELQGGLGNQLFQLAALRYASEKNNLIPAIDLSRMRTSVIPRVFELEDSVLEKLFNGSKVVKNYSNYLLVNRFKWLAHRYLPDTFFYRTFLARGFGYEKSLENLKNIRFLSGYFQTYRYIDQLNWKSKLNDYSPGTIKFLQLYDEIKLMNPVGIHIRGKDYLHDKSGIGNLSYKYFLNCINELGQVQKDLWIFTDDPFYAQHLMNQTGFHYKIVDIERQLSTLETMLLFASTKKIIISNSTFAWWSAYLSNGAIIFSPKKWFQGMNDPIDLTPQQWVKIESQWS